LSVETSLLVEDTSPQAYRVVDFVPSVAVAVTVPTRIVVVLVAVVAVALPGAGVGAVEVVGEVAVVGVVVVEVVVVVVEVVVVVVEVVVVVVEDVVVEVAALFGRTDLHTAYEQFLVDVLVARAFVELVFLLTFRPPSLRQNPLPSQQL